MLLLHRGVYIILLFYNEIVLYSRVCWLVYVLLKCNGIYEIINFLFIDINAYLRESDYVTQSIDEATLEKFNFCLTPLTNTGEDSNKSSKSKRGKLLIYINNVVRSKIYLYIEIFSN